MEHVTPKGTWVKILTELSWTQKGKLIKLAQDLQLEDDFCVVKHAGVLREVYDFEIIWEMN